MLNAARSAFWEYFRAWLGRRLMNINEPPRVSTYSGGSDMSDVSTVCVTEGKRMTAGSHHTRYTYLCIRPTPYRDVRKFICI